MSVMAAVDAEGPAAVRERLEAFGVEVLAGAVNRPVQVRNGGVYLRGLIEQGARKSLEPLAARVGVEADYQSLQQFIADSPWDPAVLVRNVAERVTGEIDVQAWVLDDTGFVKDGKRSPGVKRQYTGSLGKIGNCQIGVSLHAAGAKGTVPLGWELYLPEEWCDDAERRRKAKIPEHVVFMTKPQLGVDLAVRAAGWDVPRAPVLGDQAYGDSTDLRQQLHDAGLEYVLAVGAETKVFAPGTTFTVPKRNRPPGRPPTRPIPDRDAQPIKQLVAGLDADDWQTLNCRDGPDGKPLTSRFAFVAVRAAHKWRKGLREIPHQELLIAEWPTGADAPTDYWLSNLPADTESEQLARLARLRWKIELDYKQLKGELGLDHYEGRSWVGWHHHTALVTAAHGFLTLERLHPFRPRPA